jgi:hypothetical protein
VEENLSLARGESEANRCARPIGRCRCIFSSGFDWGWLLLVRPWRLKTVLIWSSLPSNFFLMLSKSVSALTLAWEGASAFVLGFRAQGIHRSWGRWTHCRDVRELAEWRWAVDGGGWCGEAPRERCWLQWWLHVIRPVLGAGVNKVEWRQRLRWLRTRRRCGQAYPCLPSSVDVMMDTKHVK